MPSAFILLALVANAYVLRSVGETGFGIRGVNSHGTKAKIDCPLYREKILR